MSGIRVVDAHSADTFNTFLYPQQNQNNMLYIMNQFSSVQPMLTDVGLQFMQKAKAEADMHYDPNAIQRAMLGLESLSVMERPDVVYYLGNTTDLRLAQPTMQRWLMAEPTIREKFNEQLVTGYDNYFDAEPGAIGEHHYDYRRVMNGDFRIDGDEYLIREYHEELREDDYELSLRDRNLVKFSWESQAQHILARDDTSDIFCGDVG